MCNDFRFCEMLDNFTHRMKSIATLLVKHSTKMQFQVVYEFNVKFDKIYKTF